MLPAITERYQTLRQLWVDAKYAGQTVAWIEQTLGLSVVLGPGRWVW